MAPSTIAGAINITGRKPWKPVDGNGSENDDYKIWKFWNPTMTEVQRLLETTTVAQLNANEITDKFPKRVKLSDSAIGLVIRIGVPISRCSQWWPLDLNAAGVVLGQPTRDNIGHAHRVGNDIAQVGRARGHSYTLCGNNNPFDPTKNSTYVIQRPSAKATRKTSTTIPTTSSPTSAQTTTPTPLGQRVQEEEEDTDAISNIRKRLRKRALNQVSEGDDSEDELTQTKSKSKRPKIGRDLGSLSPLHDALLPPSNNPSSPAPADQLPLSDQVSFGLAKLRELSKDFATLTGHAERLDAMIAIQSEALTSAKAMIKELLPLHRALTYKDAQIFDFQKAQSTTARYEKWIQGYNTLKDQQTQTTSERNTIRDAYIDLPEGQRIFEHGDPPEFKQNQAIRDFLASVPPEDPIDWLLTVKPNVASIFGEAKGDKAVADTFTV
ncbi:hypothetical protein BDR22DRAFT_891311 [Usnea florida]